MLAEIVDALVLKAHAVEHALGRLHHSRIVVTLARLQRSSLHDNTANLTQVHEIGKFHAIAESARSRHHGILQFQSSYFNIQFCHTLPH